MRCMLQEALRKRVSALETSSGECLKTSSRLIEQVDDLLEKSVERLRASEARWRRHYPTDQGEK